MGHPMPDKSTLRLHLRRLLADLAEEAKNEASRRLCYQIASSDVFRQARVIALFHPTSNEPNLLPLLQQPDKQFLFPLCHPDRTLTWHETPSPNEWKRSRFGIMEPDPTLNPALSSPAPDLVLVPALAYTPGGDRLGHGAGYYDRFLAALSASTTTFGVCFTCQIQTSLPVESHDVRVHQVRHA